MLTSLLHSIRKAKGIMSPCQTAEILDGQGQGIGGVWGSGRGFSVSLSTKKAKGDPLTLWLFSHNDPNPMIQTASYSSPP
jgi:hypothetical protein